jgi:hypothetical protein
MTMMLAPSKAVLAEDGRAPADEKKDEVAAAEKDGSTAAEKDEAVRAPADAAA